MYNFVSSMQWYALAVGKAQPVKPSKALQNSRTLALVLYSFIMFGFVQQSRHSQARVSSDFDLFWADQRDQVQFGVAWSFSMDCEHVPTIWEQLHFFVWHSPVSSCSTFSSAECIQFQRWWRHLKAMNTRTTSIWGKQLLPLSAVRALHPRD